MNPTHKTVTLHIRKVPRVTRDSFKAFCARRGYSMQDAMIALMDNVAHAKKPIKGVEKGGENR